MTSDKSKDAYADYLVFRQAWPRLFDNAGTGTIEILTSPEEVAATRCTGSRVAQEGPGLYYQDDFICVLRDPVRFQDGTCGLYVRVIPAPKRSRGIVIFPMRSNRVLLVRQFRHATRRFHIEIPRGFGEEGATLEENAKRELLEETGFEASEFRNLGVLHPDTGLLGMEVDLVQAFISDSAVPSAPEIGGELLELSIEELKSAIRRLEITDNFTLAAFSRVYA